MTPRLVLLVHQSIRRLLLKRFPYAVYFLLDVDVVVRDCKSAVQRVGDIAFLRGPIVEARGGR